MRIASTRRGATASLVWLAALSAFGLCVAAQAAPDEKVLAAARAQQAPLIDTLKSLVSIETGSADVEGLRKLAGLL